MRPVLFVRGQVKTGNGNNLPPSGEERRHRQRRDTRRLRNGVSYDVPRARKSRLNAYLKIRPTSYRMTHRYARLRCFYRPPVGQKKPPEPGASRRNASSSRCCIDSFARRAFELTIIRASVSDFSSLYDLVSIKKTSSPSQILQTIYISIDIYAIRWSRNSNGSLSWNV